MKYIYDAKTNAFYPIELKDSYLDKGLWPESSVEIDEETFADFQNPPPRKVRVAGGDGYPAWADIPPPTHEEQVAIAEAQRDSLLNTAKEKIIVWQTKLAIGRTLTDDEKAKLNAWLDYIDAVEAVDTNKAPDINWPTQPE